MKILLAALMLSLPAAALAEGKKIPLDEAGFVAAITNTSMTEMLESLGTPDRVVAHNDKSGKTVASVVRYRNLVSNTSGDFYKITELEVVGGKVVNVVFMNEESPDDSVDQTF